MGCGNGGGGAARRDARPGAACCPNWCSCPAGRPRHPRRQVLPSRRREVLDQGSDLRTLRAAGERGRPARSASARGRPPPDPRPGREHDPRLSRPAAGAARHRPRLRPEGLRGRPVVQAPLLPREQGGHGDGPPRRAGGRARGPRAPRPLRPVGRERGSLGRRALARPREGRALHRRAGRPRPPGGSPGAGHVRQLPSHRVPAPPVGGLLHHERLPPPAGEVPGLPAAPAEPGGREAARPRGIRDRLPQERRGGAGGPPGHAPRRGLRPGPGRDLLLLLHGRVVHGRPSDHGLGLRPGPARPLAQAGLP